MILDTKRSLRFLLSAKSRFLPENGFTPPIEKGCIGNIIANFRQKAIGHILTHLLIFRVGLSPLMSVPDTQTTPQLLNVKSGNFLPIAMNQRLG
jgi:hypothetical protein